MLPDSKDDFPKLLYLDQNKWIDLSRAHYGDPKGTPFCDALAAVRKAVSAGRLVVPFSAVHVMEMNVNRDPERRERLARFMVDLSCNRTILPFTSIRSWEIRNALHVLYERDFPFSIRGSIIREGFLNAFAMRLSIRGLPREVEAKVLEAANSPEVSVEELLAAGNRRELIDELRAEEVAILGIQEGVRERASVANVSQESRWTAEVVEYLRKGDVGKTVVECLQELGVPVDAFFGRFGTANDFNQFFSNIPILDVMLTLTLARDRDLVRRIDQNDSRDLIWLSVALPYGNLVVSENYWGNIVRSRKLDKKYQTTLITDAREIPARLSDLVLNQALSPLLAA